MVQIVKSWSPFQTDNNHCVSTGAVHYQGSKLKKIGCNFENFSRKTNQGHLIDDYM